MSYFTTAANIDALALAIIPDPTGPASPEATAAIQSARASLKANFLTEMGKFINAGINDIVSKGVPVPQDGGAFLQTTWISETST